MTRRRFIADTWTTTEAILLGDQAAHLARVLRAEPGQIVDVVAGGFLHRAEITAVDTTLGKETVRLLLHEELETDTALPLHLLLAIFKFDHLEWGIEKATELGVARITPILARRTEKHLAHASARRVDRWRRIALESAKQSRRVSIPAIADPTPLRAALASEHSSHRILLSETEQATPLSTALTSATQARPPHPSQHNEWTAEARVPHPSQRDGWDVKASPTAEAQVPHPSQGDGWDVKASPTTEARVPHPSQRDGWDVKASPTAEARVPHPSQGDGWDVKASPTTEARVPHPSQGDGWDVETLPTTFALAIGPEGGWAPDEITLFLEHHWQPVTLGPRILRAETAAIAATAILAAHLG